MRECQPVMLHVPARSPSLVPRLMPYVYAAVQVVDEAEILIAFASRVRRQSLRQTSPLPAAKKPRGVAKPLR